MFHLSPLPHCLPHDPGSKFHQSRSLHKMHCLFPPKIFQALFLGRFPSLSRVHFQVSPMQNSPISAHVWELKTHWLLAWAQKHNGWLFWSQMANDGRTSPRSCSWRTVASLCQSPPWSWAWVWSCWSDGVVGQGGCLWTPGAVGLLVFQGQPGTQRQRHIYYQRNWQQKVYTST